MQRLIAAVKETMGQLGQTALHWVKNILQPELNNDQNNLGIFGMSLIYK